MKFSKNAYFDYRAIVQLKTTGANVHTVNGLLGRIINAGYNVEIFYHKGMQEEADHDFAIVKDAIKEIFSLTGVSVEAESLFTN